MIRRPDCEPNVELLETCWQLRTAGGRVLTCAIFRVDGPGVELRAGFKDEELLRSQWTSQVALARELAASWKQVALDMGGLEEVTSTCAEP